MSGPGDQDTDGSAVASQASQPARASRASQAGRLVVLLVRAVLAAGFGGLAYWVWQHRTVYRGWEATAAGYLSHIVMHTTTYASKPDATFFLGVGTKKAFGLIVTNDCTSAVVAMVVLAATALITLVSNIGLHRLFAAALVATATFGAMNLVRLLSIAAATRRWGLGTGFHWSHIWGGTFITVFGAALTAGVYLYVLGVRRHRPTPVRVEEG